MIVEHCLTAHVRFLIAQGCQASQLRQVSHASAILGNLERPPGLAMTAREGDRILLCGGILPTGAHPALGVLWAVLAADAGRHMLWLHRATRRFIDISPLQRLEATVEDGFPAGCRWLELLGFEYEGRMRAYGLNGETHLRYARIR